MDKIHDLWVTLPSLRWDIAGDASTRVLKGPPPSDRTAAELFSLQPACRSDWI